MFAVHVKTFEQQTHPNCMKSITFYKDDDPLRCPIMGAGQYKIHTASSVLPQR